MSNPRRSFLCIVLGALLLAMTLSSVRAAGAYTLVVHKDNSKQEVTTAELKTLLSGTTKQWSSGAVVQVGLIMGESPETQFLAGLIGSSVSDLLGRIQQQVFKGEMRRPAALKSSADCVAFAASSPGALCAAAAGSLPPEVHALAVK